MPLTIRAPRADELSRLSCNPRDLQSTSIAVAESYWQAGQDRFACQAAAERRSGSLGRRGARSP